MDSFIVVNTTCYLLVDAFFEKLAVSSGDKENVALVYVGGEVGSATVVYMHQNRSVSLNQNLS